NAESPLVVGAKNTQVNADGPDVGRRDAQSKQRHATDRLVVRTDEPPGYLAPRPQCHLYQRPGRRGELNVADEFSLVVTKLQQLRSPRVPALEDDLGAFLLFPAYAVKSEDVRPRQWLTVGVEQPHGHRRSSFQHDLLRDGPRIDRGIQQDDG